jgi:copper(I)-binding protein
MKHIALTLCLLAGASLAQAQAQAMNREAWARGTDVCQSQQVTIRDAWARGTVPMQKSSGVFMQITSEKEVRLVSAKSPVSNVTELHEMVMDKDVMKMREIPGLDIVPGRILELKPGGYHVMLIDLKAQLKGGDLVPITLTFEDYKTKTRFTQDVSVPVTALGAGTGPAAKKPMGH